MRRRRGRLRRGTHPRLGVVSASLPVCRVRCRVRCRFRRVVLPQDLINLRVRWTYAACSTPLYCTRWIARRSSHVCDTRRTKKPRILSLRGANHRLSSAPRALRAEVLPACQTHSSEEGEACCGRRVDDAPVSLCRVGLGSSYSRRAQTTTPYAL